MASGIVRRTMVYLGLTDDDEFEYESYEEAPEPAPAAAPQRRGYPETAAPSPAVAVPAGAAVPAAAASSGSASGGAGGSVATPRSGGSRSAPMRTLTPRQSSKEPSGTVGVTPTPRRGVVRPISPPQAARVHVVTPSRFADAQEIGDHFKAAQPVLVDLQHGDRELSRRMIDFCSGITYGLDGGMEKVADQVFLLTPANVEVSADEKRKLAEKGLYRL